MSGDYSSDVASFLDKTDWRKSIHKCLDLCVSAEGTIYYPQRVKSLVSAVAAPFPNFNARKIIGDYLEKLDLDYKEKIEEFVEKYPDYWIHWGKRKMIEPDIVDCYFHDIFDFIFCLLAERRMLLMGPRKISGGSQMED